MAMVGTASVPWRTVSPSESRVSSVTMPLELIVS